MVATSRIDTSCSPSTASARATGRAGARQPLQPQQHRRAHRVRAQRGHSARACGGGLDPLGAHLAHELLEQERVAAGGVVARRGEARVRGAEQRLDRCPAPSGDSGPGRIETVAGSARISASGTAQLAHVGGAHRQEQHHRQVADPQAQEALGGHRRLVGPLGVVDGDEQRALAGEVRGEPVEAVQALVHQLGAVGVLGAGGIQDRQRKPGRAGEERRALLVGLVERDRVGRLAHDAVRIAALELGRSHRRACTSRARGRARCRRVTRLDFPMPGGPSTATTLPRPSTASPSAWSRASSSDSRSRSSGSGAVVCESI